MIEAAITTGIFTIIACGLNIYSNHRITERKSEIDTSITNLRGHIDDKLNEQNALLQHINVVKQEQFRKEFEIYVILYEKLTNYIEQIAICSDNTLRINEDLLINANAVRNEAVKEMHKSYPFYHYSVYVITIKFLNLLKDEDFKGGFEFYRKRVKETNKDIVKYYVEIASAIEERIFELANPEKEKPAHPEKNPFSTNNPD